MPRSSDADWRPIAIIRRGGLAVPLEVASVLCTIGVFVAVERTFDPPSLGVYGIATAVGLLLLVVGSLGTSALIVREGATRPDEFRNLSIASFWARTAFLLVLIAPAMLLSSSTVFGLLVLNTSAFLYVDLAGAVLRGQERYVAAAVITLAHRITMLVVVLAAATSGDLEVVAIALTIATVVIGVTSVRWAFSRAGFRMSLPPLGVLVGTLRRHFRGALTLRASVVDVEDLRARVAVSGVASRLDVVLVAMLAASTSPGGRAGASAAYVAAAVVAVALSNLAAILLVFAFPRLSAAPAKDAGREARRIAFVTFVAAAVAAGVGVLLARAVIETLYGTTPALAEAVSILRIFVISFPFILAGRILIMGFVAIARSAFVLAIQLGGTAWLLAAVVIGFEIDKFQGAAIGAASADVAMFAFALLAWYGVERGMDQRSRSPAGP